MALLPDEQYVMISDSIEKKKIARSSHNRKTHCGKGGRVKFPSDYLSKKELKAMNSDVKSYNLNRPMTWKEFRSMPQDLQIMYIKKLRNEFGVPDIILAKAMGVCKSVFSETMRDLNISLGKSAGAKSRQWSGSEKSFKFSEYWNKFNKEKAVEEDRVEEEEDIEEKNVNEEAEDVKETDISKAFAQIGAYVAEGFAKDTNRHDELSTKTANNADMAPVVSPKHYLGYDLSNYAVCHTAEPEHIAIPTGGRLSFDCRFDDAIKVLESILSGTNVRLNVDWVVVKGD